MLGRGQKQDEIEGCGKRAGLLEMAREGQEKNVLGTPGQGV